MKQVYYEYTKRDGGFDRGFRPSSIYLTLPISRNLGEPDLDRYDVEYDRGSLTLDHRFSENLQLRSLLLITPWEQVAFPSIPSELLC